MAYKLACADSGAKCAFEVTTESEKELMEHVQVHAKHAHPEMVANPPSPEMIKQLIRNV